MSCRERWSVYLLLLFMTLGIIMRDKVWSQSHFKAIGVTAEYAEVYRQISARSIQYGVAVMLSKNGKHGC